MGGALSSGLGSGGMGTPAIGFGGAWGTNNSNLTSSVSDEWHRVNHMPSVNAGLNTLPNPALANITNPVSPGAIQGAQAGVGNSLASQNALLAALQAQNGLGKQGQVFDQGQGLYGQLAGANGLGAQQQAMNQQGSLAGQLGNAGGIGYQQQAAQGLQDVYGRQAQTAGQLQGIANGTGPNPAQAALNQSTGQNVANQAALMASQRGAGANVGLIARQAAQQGAATQQQAAGQAATLQAQQELGALGQLSGQQQAMAGTAQGLAGIGSGLTAQQQAAIAQQYGQGSGITGQQQAQFNANAGIAANQVGNQIGATNQASANQLANQGQILGSAGQYNADITSGQGSVNAGNTALNQTSMQGRQAVTGGLLNAAGPLAKGIGSIFAGSEAAGGLDAGGAAAGDAAGEDAALAAATVARGGYVQHHYADGGDVYQPDSGPATVGAPSPTQQSGPMSSFGKFLAGKDANQDNMTPHQALQKGTTNFLTGILPTAAKGGLAKGGGPVKATSPKEKAVKRGNSYANDKVPALLSEGEIVIPRNIVQSKDPARSAADFVAKVLAKRRIGK